MRRIFLANFVMVLLVAPVYAAESGNQIDTALVDLNSSFINAHAAARKLDLTIGGPIILLRAGQLVLVRNNTETAANIILPEYNTFKMFAHIPVAIYLMLGPPGTGKLDFERLQQLLGYHQKMKHVEKNLPFRSGSLKPSLNSKGSVLKICTRLRSACCRWSRRTLQVRPRVSSTPCIGKSSPGKRK